MKLKPIFLPILIIVLIVITRLSFLSQIPTSLTQDEAAIGYNAFSILKTAKADVIGAIISHPNIALYSQLFLRFRNSS